ncbi:hypothetical protein H0H81_002432 [Sphagnurus paluster]|uniref:Cytochrome P450 n=1 Tax=Sphagnurus paluster TaxID=117069 RepID=A0A9P7FS19_9AGAR|nr:hypothetical protein H0H81_002432 [Sphagnurus paluster]
MQELYDRSSSTFSSRPHFLGYAIPLLPSLLAIFIVSRVIKLLSGIRAVNQLPGLWVPLQPLSNPSGLLKTSWWNIGVGSNWYWRGRLYKDLGSETIAVVPFLIGVPTLFTSNLDVARQILSGQAQGHGLKERHFDKSEAMGRMIMKWGMNLVAARTSDDVWRKHRRIVGSAFNNQLYELVWTETLNTYRQMEAAESWDTKDTVDVPIVPHITSKMALLIIARCGFGFSFDWTAPPMGPDGTMSVQESLRILADSSIVSLMAPDWVRYLPLPGFDKIRTAFGQFSAFMRREIEARTREVRSAGDGDAEGADARTDAFTILVRANERETGKFRLDAQEVVSFSFGCFDAWGNRFLSGRGQIGNVFVMLFAGYETTGHTLSATLALLAIHQDVQDEILEQIVSVVGYDRDPTYADYEKLDKVLSAFYEALRLFPTAYLIMREATEDTVLDLPNAVGQEGSTPFAVTKGTSTSSASVRIPMPTRTALDSLTLPTEYNPRYHEDPQSFKSSRWHGTGEPEPFVGFSTGPRACIGRKFATTEAVVFLTMLLRDWRIEPMCRDGESNDAWAERAFAHPVFNFTLSVRDTPVRFVRRERRGV